MALRLMIEQSNDFRDFDYLLEKTSVDSKNNLYIKGPYMMAEGVNRNGRLYPLEEMQREVARYKEEMITTGRAMGELNHPNSADVDLGRACHLVTEMWQEGNVFYGKSKVLSTDCGKIVKCLVEDGVKVGMSSRALGRLEESDGKNVVRDLRLVCVDCVADPSFPKAFVNGILESKQWVLQDNGTLEECYSEFENKISKLPKKDIEAHLKKSIMSFLKNIK